ncbi:pyridoxamine 5'-phosphate oxidase family protein [Porphyrobacter sp. ULC335]|uniref:pyridoxamine 5'-phosphate oxidase family protein n=1 Tax=Porphyrobacter sp. ULC335 TaxID=2854260 RepID=UPI00221F8430|nr:pyridoxamine 5'-phosphate oxidase family protein [Porphyrobacter sp. ULC335]UYV14362.1 pyridoxamine 5'-phosphate oxidase family protein [Porphyrobacter sp. ULC335]
MIETLEDVLTDCRNRLIRAPRDRKAPMHTPVIVTGDVDARVMVLREFDSTAWRLRFHTDSRAPKAQVIDADPRVAVLFYDKGAKVQIRARGVGEILRDGEQVDRAWAASTNFARRCYLGEGPGAGSDSPTSGLPPEFEGVEPDDAQLIPARENFALLRITLTAFDWLYLAHTGHVRAQFARGDAERADWQGRWVSP